MKQAIIITTLLSIFAIGILMALNYTNGAPNRKKNGFTRKFQSYRPKEIAHIDFNYPIHKIISVKHDSIFCTSSKPGLIYLFTEQLRKIDTFNLTMPSDEKMESLFYTDIHFPEVTIVGGNSKSYIKGDLITKTYYKTQLPSIGVFAHVTFLGNDIFIMKAIDSITLNSKFMKINGILGTVEVEKNISPELKDAGFTYEGDIHYDQKSNKVFSVSFYANKIFCFDTSFNSIGPFHTIDTTYLPNISITHKPGSVTQNKPPVKVNSESFIDDGELYVRSELRGDNENTEISQNNNIFDIYSTENGKYISSFYIPKIAGISHQTYYKRGSILVALYNQKLLMYELNRDN